MPDRLASTRCGCCLDMRASFRPSLSQDVTKLEIRRPAGVSCGCCCSCFCCCLDFPLRRIFATPPPPADVSCGCCCSCFYCCLDFPCDGFLLTHPPPPPPLHIFCISLSFSHLHLSSRFCAQSCCCLDFPLRRIFATPPPPLPLPSVSSVSWFLFPICIYRLSFVRKGRSLGKPAESGHWPYPRCSRVLAVVVRAVVAACCLLRRVAVGPPGPSPIFSVLLSLSCQRLWCLFRGCARASPSANPRRADIAPTLAAPAFWMSLFVLLLLRLSHCSQLAASVWRCGRGR